MIQEQDSVLTERQLFSKKADFLDHPAFPNSFWRIAVLAVTAVVGIASCAEAATSFYWPDYYDDGISRPRPIRPPRPHKARHRLGAKNETLAKESAKPQGPLIVAISIERQSLKLYDANGLFAETPISTGMRGHPTPMGVFSIIQKQKFHRSNIYSGAPMPFMQRITWSGVAMHAGVLPGYPASHGCIRMPTSFAVKMWGWTRMGARVLITPGELAPSSFSHPLLAMQKTAATPLAPPPTQKQPVSTEEPDKPTPSSAPIMPPSSASAPLTRPQQAQTANAGDTLPRSTAPATMLDAAVSTSGPATDKPGHETLAALLVTTEMKASDTPESSAQARRPRDQIDDQTTATGAPPSDLKKDQTRSTEVEAPAGAKPDQVSAPKHAGQIAVFISRKDGKLYVRQNFAPLFEAAVTVAGSDRPLGTHVFTAQADKNDPKSFHWSVVTLPTARHAERADDDERVSRRRKTVGAVETRFAPLPDSPAEALDRISIPADAMARMIDLLSTGGSLIVSDQGITAGETGEGTDFIVSLR